MAKVVDDNQNPEVFIKDEETSIRKKKFKFNVNKETLPLKFTLFLFYGAMSATLPYVTIHMQALGISITEVAIIYAILPFTSFIGPPILGAVADKFGNYKYPLILATFGNGLFHTMLLFVPVYSPATIINITSNVQFDKTTNEANIMFNRTFCNTSATIIQNVFTITECKGNISKAIIENDECLVNLNGTLNFDTEYNNNGLLMCTTNILMSKPEIGSNQITFWVYFIIRIVATIFMASCFSLLDATTLAIVKRCGSKVEYGKERIWSIFGTAVVSPLAGILVDRLSRPLGYTDYSSAFYLSDALLLCSILTFFFIELQLDKPDKGILKNGAKLFRYPEVVVFLVMIFLLGNLWGFVESYLFIFLKELQAPNYLLGLTLTVGSIVGLPFLWGSEKIVAKVGRVNLIIVAFVTYFVRFFGYSYLINPFWCFPFEAMEAFTLHLMWTSAATYCVLLSPKGMLASLMGIMGSLHYSLGKGAGSFFGGLTYGKVGARLSFRYFGIVSGVFGLIFFILDFFWIRKIVARRLKETQKEEQEMRPISPRRGSIFDANPFSQLTSMVDLDKDDEEDEEIPPESEKLTSS